MIRAKSCLALNGRVISSPIIMMALAMEVITPLIGGKGLGLEVFTGMSTASIGVSLQAGIGIVLLAIILDRISQAWTKTQREAMGLS